MRQQPLNSKSTFAYEIILIDDGSNDGSEITCDKYGSENGIVRVIHKLNGGVSSARNTGLSVAKGEFVWFVDSDDYAEKIVSERSRKPLPLIILIFMNSPLSGIIQKYH